MKKRKGLSPVIATVLLIAMTMVMGLIVFMWFRGLTQEKITKFDGTNIQLVCDDVSFEASYSSSGMLSILNSGNVPIYGIKIKVSGDGSFATHDLKDLSTEWATNYKAGLNQGMGFSGAVTFSGSPDEIILIPVLIGDSDQGKKTYTCDGELHGYKIVL